MITLEERLRDHYNERTASVPEHGPGLGAPPFLSALGDNDLRASRWRMAFIGSAAAAMIVGLALVAGFRSSGVETEPAASGPGDVTTGQAALAPVVTLADTGDLTDVPITVLTDAPAEWYRLAPDLDVAWYQDQINGADSMVCWRTPLGSDCQADNTRPGESVFAVPTGGGQTLVIMIAGEVRRDTLDVVLDDGVVLVSPIEWDETINWGVARYAIPNGAAIARLGDGASVPSDTIADANPPDVESSTSLLDRTSGPIPSTPSGTAADLCDAGNECGTYIVSKGDYPVMIAERFCVTITELSNANGWKDISEFPFPDVPISIPPSDGRTTCPEPSD
jgi:hypothetical protein